MSHNDAESRITDLETKMAHMDTMINDLSDMIKSQWDRIDILERRNRLMSDDVKRMGDFMRTSSEDDVPPPHY
ncbi:MULTISPECIES: SlyX family protein [Thalassospira]|uniref:SlyX family protein n=1 Tax=Thalassospira TaxID=168934 RepID=UPI0003B4174C|nr:MULTISPECIES: SlyX family protein [Thalassospira]RCK29422.1 SlyX family protein [Thalassospira lucentensis MCCC 1A00383 = DSM 14000]|tara:strand:+ start:210350 stop:210568 length:219 start_codon:yes stop_codon:yes gene_type:complete